MSLILGWGVGMDIRSKDLNGVDTIRLKAALYIISQCSSRLVAHPSSQ